MSPRPQTVFIAGSIAISRLHATVEERIGRVIEKELAVVVGDADGADTAIQQSLAAQGATTVTVFCSGDMPRNNVGGWPVESIHPDAPPGTRRWFTAKDVAMAEAADYGLMIWDSRSTGTLTNVIELLGQEKTSIVYVNKNKEFQKITNVDDLDRLVEVMSATARTKAEDKMRLGQRIAALRNHQGALAF